ncbi:MAG: hypothetical protein ACJAVV_002802 [Alphaproteobacteria bacterium]|jgi:hypothetical protein
MNINFITFETIRWASFPAILAIVSYGFFTPISVVQALLYNPLLIVGLLGILAYVSDRLGGMKKTAEIHHLAINKKQEQHSICRAA